LSQHDLDGPPPQWPPDCAAVARTVCHRVKNDLQMLMNLLVLAEARAGTPQALSEAVQKRLSALGAVYTLIADEGRQPTAQALAREVARRVLARHGLAPAIHTEGEPLPLSLRLCSPLALWLGEVIDNAVCHGRAADGAARLAFLADRDDDEVWLAVGDAGPGLPPRFDIEVHAGLGLRLAMAVAQRDLGGAMALHSDRGGVTAKLRVPEREFRRLATEAWR